MTILGDSPSPITCRLDATIYFLVPPPTPCTSWISICCDGGLLPPHPLGVLPTLGHAQFSTLGRVMHGQVQKTLHDQSAQMVLVIYYGGEFLDTLGMP
jgi:hypothetical protein